MTDDREALRAAVAAVALTGLHDGLSASQIADALLSGPLAGVLAAADAECERLAQIVDETEAERDALAAKVAAVEALLRDLGPVRTSFTHSEGCYTWHIECLSWGRPLRLRAIRDTPERENTDG